MDYRGTPNDDRIDQRQQGIPDGAAIYGDDGNDTIVLANGLAIGGAGNDTIVSNGDWASVAYWGAPRGVAVDLGRGVAQDGSGGTDTLVGIRVVQGSSFDDTLTGGDANEFFYGGAGSNTVSGGAGFDTVSYYFEKSTAADISYDSANDTFTVVKHFANGDRGIDKLSGIEKIEFSGAGSDGKSILRAQYVGDFRLGGSTLQVAQPADGAVSQFKTGDFNGDGHADLAYVTQVGTGTASAPTFVLLGDGKGGFVDGTAQVFVTTPMKVVGGGRTIVADFNDDGASDLFQLDFGNDAPPFAGGINSLYLSTAAGGLRDDSATLPQRLAQNHGGSAGDVNGDGHVDVLVNTLDAGNQLLINDGSGHFYENASRLPRSSGPGGQGLADTSTFSGIVDVNGDGAPDLILGTWDGNAAGTGSKVLLNDGEGNFTAQGAIGLPASGIAKEIVLDVEAIDLNGDRFADLMLSVTNGGERDAFYHTDYVQLLVNDGSGHFRDETATRLPQSKDSTEAGWLMSLSSVDFNHDGHADILAESAGDPVTSKLYLNRGDGSFALAWESDPGARVIAADIDEDGMTDLVSASSAGLIGTWINKLPNGHVYRAGFGGDMLRGSSGADVFYASSDNQAIDGAGGVDVALFDGSKAAYAVTTADGALALMGNGSAATLRDVERVRFADGALAFDLAGTAGQAYRIYQAAFGRVPDQAGLGYWIDAMDHGLGLNEVAAQFVASAEFASRYGALDGNAFLTTIYRNVLHREPDAAGYAYWNGHLDHDVTRPQMLAMFSESTENQAQVIAAIQHGIAYEPYR